MPEDSHLLVNNGGKFQIAGPETAPALSGIGLVTSGLWSDVDGDGWTDLLLTLEWGAVRYLRNDGDIDYIAMNFGLNTKYHADHKHPVTLYAKDFDGNGRFDLVESEWEGDKCFPIRGKSCSCNKTEKQLESA